MGIAASTCLVPFLYGFQGPSAEDNSHCPFGNSDQPRSAQELGFNATEPGALVAYSPILSSPDGLASAASKRCGKV
ncbi:hypothetical protein B0T13DRAFT_509815 [Neurospora crassa]|nr:hypothetical protein B0T13DRAFT_509815 [Neurospora crassa]